MYVCVWIWRWQQLVRRRPWSKVVVYLCSAVFLTSKDLCLLVTRPNSLRVWGKVAPSLQSREMHRWGRLAPELRSSWGRAELTFCLRMCGAKDILCGRCFYHYGYLPTRFVSLMLCPCRLIWRMLNNTRRAHLAQTCTCNITVLHVLEV